MSDETKLIFCPAGPHAFTLEQAWNQDKSACVHYIDGKKIIDLACPECGVRVKEEMK
jgi:hypothetical protein